MTFFYRRSQMSKGGKRRAYPTFRLTAHALLYSSRGRGGGVVQKTSLAHERRPSLGRGGGRLRGQKRVCSMKTAILTRAGQRRDRAVLQMFLSYDL